MPKLSKRQLQSRKNTLCLQRNLDYKGSFEKKRPFTVEIADADDAEDRTAQQEWSLNIHELSGSESDEERDDVMFQDLYTVILIAMILLVSSVCYLEKR